MHPLDEKRATRKTKLINVKSVEDTDDSAFKSDFFNRKSKSVVLLGSGSSIDERDYEDDRKETNKNDHRRTKSFDMGSLREFKRDDFIKVSKNLFEWSENLNKVKSFRLSSSMINLNIQEENRTNVKKTFRTSETQTDSCSVDEQSSELPAIRIIRPSIQGKHFSPRKIQFLRRKLSVQKESDDEKMSSTSAKFRQGKTPTGSPKQSKANMTSTAQTIKRSFLIMGAFAIAYFPLFIVFVLHLGDVISDQGLLNLEQIARCNQYLYFAFVPLIYVYTNKGLLKSLNQAPRN